MWDPFKWGVRLRQGKQQITLTFADIAVRSMFVQLLARALEDIVVELYEVEPK